MDKNELILIKDILSLCIDIDYKGNFYTEFLYDNHYLSIYVRRPGSVILEHNSVKTSEENLEEIKTQLINITYE